MADHDIVRRDTKRRAHAVHSKEEERLLGFDAREFWLDLSKTWPEERRSAYLYRVDVVRPLSIDRRVWLSIFDSIPRPEPPGKYGFQDCWADFLSLRRGVTQLYEEEPLPPYRMVAMSLVKGRTEWPRKHAAFQPGVPTARPSTRDDSWELAGYDVGDQWMLSALMNCGFVSGLDDVSALRREWEPHLNEFHLFADLDAAEAFRAMSDERLRDDHAPTFVYAIWFMQ